MHRYAGTSIGIVWHVIQPLSTIALFSFIFAGLFPSRPGTGAGVNPALYITAGMLPWLAFSDCINRCVTSLVDNAHYLRKLALPEIVFVARTATTAAMMMLISLGLIAVTAILFGILPHWSWLTVPVAGLL
ncbi:ABC transporter permease, partial [Cupriavidus sp. 2MCAB6]